MASSHQTIILLRTRASPRARHVRQSGRDPSKASDFLGRDASHRRRANGKTMDRMRRVEIQARSVDEAVRLALEQLDRTREQVEIEILADAQDELDGEALVRVTAKDRAGKRMSVTGKAERPCQETERIAKRVVGELLQAMGYHCDLVAVDNPSGIEGGPEEPPTVFIDILGRDLGMLIGRRGENLAQIQYMVNLLVNKQLPTWTRVILDVEG